MTDNEYRAYQARILLQTVLMHAENCCNTTRILLEELKDNETCESIEKEIGLITDLYDILSGTQYEMVREAAFLQTRSFELNAND